MRALIEHDGLSGVTSNPAIFDEAVSEGAEYAQAIEEGAKRGLSAEE